MDVVCCHEDAKHEMRNLMTDSSSSARLAAVHEQFVSAMTVGLEDNAQSSWLSASFRTY